MASRYGGFTVRRDPLASLILPIPLGEADETGRIPLPESLVIATWGESRDLKGDPVIVNEKTASVLAANQAKLGREEVALDFEHNTWDKKTPEPKPVASYGTLSVQEGVGIIWTPLAESWTPEGTSYYTGKHYRDISPTVYRDENGVVIGIHSVALTRAGQVSHLKAYSLSASSADLAALSADIKSDTSTTMDYQALLAKLLGISPDDLAGMTEEDIIAKADALAAAAAPKEEKKEETEPTPMSARLDAIERTQLLQDAKLAGKIIPLSAEAFNALPLSAAKALIDGLESGKVPTSARTSETVDDAKPKALSADEKEVCKQLGLTEEQFRKGNA